MINISEDIKKAIGTEIEVVVKPTNDEFGDYTTNLALRMAGVLCVSPKEYFDKVKNKISGIEYIESVDFLNGFINLRINSKALAKETTKLIHEKQYIKKQDEDSKVAIVEYPSPNMAKPYSVGHLRSGNQGWAAKKILEQFGWKVITDNHIGDYGTPFGIWAEGFELLSDKERLEKDGIYELGRIYVEMRKRIKDEAKDGKTEIANRVQKWLKRLSEGDKKAIYYHDKFYGISLQHIHDVMNRLKIDTDYEYGETFYVDLAQQLVDEYVTKGVLKENDDGSVIADLSDVGFDTPILLRKSNGLPLYASTDVATIVFRKEKFDPDLVVYSVGNEQQFYFEQLFAFSKKLGFDYKKYHLSYGMIEDIDSDTGKRQKMSSRKGTVLLEELLDKAEEKVREIVEDKTVPKEDIQKVSVGAIKFKDFAQDRKNNYLFDWDTIFNLTGYSGPYVQYAIVRMRKILNKRKDVIFDGEIVDEYGYEMEKEILIKLHEYPDMLKRIVANFSFHTLAAYLYDMARLVNAYYEKAPILKDGVAEKDQIARLKFLKCVTEIMTNGLEILGIEVPDRM